MSSTSATCLVTSPEVLKTNSTFGSFFFQSSIDFFAHQFAPPIQPWSAVGMVTPILIFFVAAVCPEALPPNTASAATNTAVTSFFMVASVEILLLPLPLDEHLPDDHKAFDRPLQVAGDAPHVEHVVDDAQGDRADHRTPDGASPAGHGRAADDDRGDRIQLVVHAERGRADRVEAHGDQDRRDADHDAGDGICGEARRVDVDGGVPRDP